MRKIKVQKNSILKKGFFVSCNNTVIKYATWSIAVLGCEHHFQIECHNQFHQKTKGLLLVMAEPNDNTKFPLICMIGH